MATGVYKHKTTQGFQKGHGIFRNDYSVSSETRNKISESLKGNTPWNKGKKTGHIPWNKCTKGVMGSYWKGKKRPDISARFKGEGHPNWKGGFYDPYESAFRKQVVYKEWRTAVFTRDDYTCQSCGQHGGNLQADHELPFALFPALRLEVLNGRTLCIPCHKETATYGGKMLTYTP